MKTITKAVISGFIISMFCSFLGFSGRCDSVSDKIFRLHIIANSDSADDQALKLRVRDRILNDFGDNFSSAADVVSAEQVAEEKLNEIENMVQDEILKNGYDYTAKAGIVHMYFDTRYYGDITMPAGYYDALRITIGEGKGKNWWCVMFPPMCLPAAEGPAELEKVLNNGEVDMLGSGEKYVLEFKMVDFYVKCQELIRRFVYEPYRKTLGKISPLYETRLIIFDIF